MAGAHRGSRTRRGSQMVAQQRATRIAVVGFGYWGAKHVRVLSSTPGVAVSVVDADEDRLAEAEGRFPAAKLATGPTDVLDGVPAVLVAPPPRSHFPIARRALEGGRHVLVEKPLTTSV